MHLEQAIKEGLKTLDDAFARLDVERLLCHILNKPSSYLYTWPDQQLTQAQAHQFNLLLQRRAQGEPVAYLINKASFWDISLEVSPCTLIPRPETELLVDWALTKLTKKQVRLVDLGTGTGAIALAIAKTRPAWDIHAVDFQITAVNLAKRNAKRLQLNHVKIVQGDCFDPLEGCFDVILSNPPYVDPSHPALLEDGVKFEPLTALISKEQGMADLQSIISKASRYLFDKGWLVLEHGYDQADRVQTGLQGQGFKDIFTLKDLNGHERVTGGCFVSSSKTGLA